MLTAGNKHDEIKQCNSYCWCSYFSLLVMATTCKFYSFKLTQYGFQPNRSRHLSVVRCLLSVALIIMNYLVSVLCKTNRSHLIMILNEEYKWSSNLDPNILDVCLLLVMFINSMVIKRRNWQTGRIVLENIQSPNWQCFVIIDPFCCFQSLVFQIMMLLSLFFIHDGLASYSNQEQGRTTLLFAHIFQTLRDKVTVRIYWFILCYRIRYHYRVDDLI